MITIADTWHYLLPVHFTHLDTVTLACQVRSLCFHLCRHSSLLFLFCFSPPERLVENFRRRSLGKELKLPGWITYCLFTWQGQSSLFRCFSPFWLGSIKPLEHIMCGYDMNLDFLQPGLFSILPIVSNDKLTSERMNIILMKTQQRSSDQATWFRFMFSVRIVLSAVLLEVARVVWFALSSSAAASS